MTWTLLGEGLKEPLEVRNFTQLEDAVERGVVLAKERYDLPTFVELSSGSSVMGIVAGGARSYAMFMYLPNGPAFVSRRHDELGIQSTEPFIFMASGSWSEVSLDTTVLPDEAWAALRQYFETGERPNTLDWGP